jgi:hypothetical protein
MDISEVIPTSRRPMGAAIAHFTTATDIQHKGSQRPEDITSPQQPKDVALTLTACRFHSRGDLTLNAKIS